MFAALRVAIGCVVVGTLAVGQGVPNEEPDPPQRPKIGLVLSGGGARGAAHVGVLKVLHELRIPIDLIAGNSMGALVGGNFAFGYSPEELQEVLETINWPLVLRDGSERSDLSFRRKLDDKNFLIDYELGLRGIYPVLPRGIAQGHRSLNILKFLTLGWNELDDFDDLPIPFRAVATDIANGEEVVLESGSLPLALAASMAIPGVFAPVRIGDRELMDGMVVNNVPIGVALDMGADVLIVVDVGTPILKADEITTMLAVTGQMIDLLIQKSIDEQFGLIEGEDQHTIVRPDLGNFGSTDFTRLTEAVTRGEEAARAMASSLRRYSVSEEEYAAFLEHQRRERAALPVVDRIVIDNNTPLSEGVIRSKLATQAGQPLNLEILKADLDRIFGLKDFERVTFEFPELEDGTRELRIDADGKSWGPSYLKFGVNLEDNLNGSSNYNFGVNYTRRALNELGGEWRNEFQFGDRIGSLTEFFQPLDERGRFFIAPQANYIHTDINVTAGEQLLAELRVLVGELALDVGAHVYNWGELRLGYHRVRGFVDVKSSVAPMQDFDFDDGFLLAQFVVDSFDDVNFPTTGTSGRIAWSWASGSIGADVDYQKFSVGAAQAGTIKQTTGVLIGEFGTVLQGTLPPHQAHFLGGFLSLSGFEGDQLSGQHLGRVAVVGYNQFAGARSEIFGFPMYVGASCEYGAVTNLRDDLARNAILAGSVFVSVDLPIAPLYVGYGRAEGGVDSFYLFLGQTF